MLTANRLTLWRGYRCLFEDLDVAIPAGRVGVVRGANGSGKTTLLRVLAGLTRPEAGDVMWHGENIDRNRAGYGGQMSYLGHRTGLKSDLTVRQNLDFAGRLYGARGEQDGASRAALELDSILTLPVRYLSAGQQRRVALARLLDSAARLWLMDEPMTNLDARGQAFIATAIADHLHAGGTAVVATHGELGLPRELCLQIELGEGA